jgi:hypothetical protein
MSAPSEVNDDDIRVLDPPLAVKAAAALQAICGVLIAVTGVQLFFFVDFYSPWLDLVKYAFFVTGVLQLVVASRVYRARLWAAYAGAALGVAIALVILAWNLFSMLNVGFSCVASVSAPLAMLTALVAFFAIGPTHKVAQARARLADQGMDLGV